jgi:hypothetical protein
MGASGKSLPCLAALESLDTLFHGAPVSSPEKGTQEAAQPGLFATWTGRALCL